MAPPTTIRYGTAAGGPHIGWGDFKVNDAVEGRDNDRCVLDFQKLANGDEFDGDGMKNASICARRINVNPAGFTKINIPEPDSGNGGKLVCGTLDASRQGDGGTVLESVAIEDGVNGTCWWDHADTGNTYDTANSPKPDQQPPANPAVGDVYYTYPQISPPSWEQTKYLTNWTHSSSSQSEDWIYPDSTNRWRLKHNHTEPGEYHDPVYGWEVTNTSGGSGPSAPRSESRPTNPRPGDSYTVISDIQGIPGTGNYEWTETTYTWVEVEAEYWDDDEYYYDRIDERKVHHQGEDEHTYSEHDNPDYILGNLLAADVGSLASIDIPAIKGVDAHNCHIKGKSGAQILIGGRDFLNELQTDWGSAEHLCLYGNGIGPFKKETGFYGNPSFEFQIGCDIPGGNTIAKGRAAHPWFTGDAPGFRMHIRIDGGPEKQFYSRNSGWVGGCRWYDYNSGELSKSYITQKTGLDWNGGERVRIRMQNWGPSGSWLGGGSGAGNDFATLSIWPFG